MKRRRKQSPAPAPVRRLNNWPALLAQFIEENRREPFAWGTRDCCLFASNGVRAITGLDPAAKTFRGKYRDLAGAMRLVRKHGGVEAIAAKQCCRLGFPELPAVALARRGDVVLIDTPNAGPAMGICLGAQAAFAGPHELTFVPLGECRRAWRVG
jgi:hypothetical protein